MFTSWALGDYPGMGKVDLGHAKLSGSVSRDDVAAVAVELLNRGGAGGLWIDLIGGTVPVEDAVKHVVSQRITSKE